MAELFADVGGGERGERHGLITRRVVMSLLAVIPLLALLDVFGQRPTSTTNDRAETCPEFAARYTSAISYAAKCNCLETRANFG